MAREEGDEWPGTSVVLRDRDISNLLMFYLKGFWHGWSQNRSPYPERDVPKLDNFRRTFFSQVLKQDLGIEPTPAQRMKIEQWIRDFVAIWQE